MGVSEQAVRELLTAAVGDLTGGVSRPGQVTFSLAAAGALSRKGHLLCEAPTGTGKSLAYLVPALLAGETVVVATKTKALQAQLMGKDVPELLRVVEATSGQLPVVELLKGKSNYACLMAADLVGGGADQLAFEVDDSAAVSEQVARLAEWATSGTLTGDRDEVPFPVLPAAWSRISVSSAECVGRARCARGEDCFSEQARERAAEADVVITNHAMLAANSATEDRLLPEFALAVVDEAHELVESFRAAETAEISLRELRILGRSAHRFVSDNAFFAWEEASERFEAAVRAAPTGECQVLPGDLPAALSKVVAATEQLARGIGSTKGTTPLDVAKHQAKTQAVLLGEKAVAMLEPDLDHVTWVKGGAFLALCRAPLDVSQAIWFGLFKDRGVVAASATLTVRKSLAHVAREWGLPKPVEAPATAGGPPQGLIVPSPFDHAKQAYLYIADDLPDPSTEPSEAFLARVVDLVQAAGGRALVICSAWTTATVVAERLRADVDLPVLLQGEDALPTLVRTFREEPSAVLVGVRSLEQGLDAPGSTCQLVIIDRIPFPHVHDPVQVALKRRLETGGMSSWLAWSAIQLPHATTRLQQGVGRLIRAEGDRGVVAVLDPRLGPSGKSYRHDLLGSLATMRSTTDLATVLGALERLRESAPPPLPVPAAIAIDDVDVVRLSRVRKPKAPEPVEDSSGWSQMDRDLLVAGVKAGRSLATLAARADRSEDDVREMAAVLGLEVG